LSPDELKQSFLALELPTATMDRINEAIQCKTIDQVQSMFNISASNLTRLFSLMEANGLADWIVFDPSTVRGLTYYTSTVFEAFDRQGKFSIHLQCKCCETSSFSSLQFDLLMDVGLMVHFFFFFLLFLMQDISEQLRVVVAMIIFWNHLVVQQLRPLALGLVMQ
jgi:hypothetical protein